MIEARSDFGHAAVGVQPIFPLFSAVIETIQHEGIGAYDAADGPIIVVLMTIGKLHELFFVFGQHPVNGDSQIFLPFHGQDRLSGLKIIVLLIHDVVQLHGEAHGRFGRDE